MRYMAKNSLFLFYFFGIILFIFGSAGSSLLHGLFLQLWQVGDTLQLWCAGFSLRWLLLLQSMGSRVRRLHQLYHMGSVVATPGLQSTGSVVVAHRLSCSVTCGIFLDQGQNPCLSHWQADYLPLSHQESPKNVFFNEKKYREDAVTDERK